MRAIICGAGIAGLATANFLIRDDWEVVVLEKAPGLRTAGYMVDFFGSGYDAAEASGLLPALAERHHEVEGIAYLDRTGRQRSMLDYRQFRAALGGKLLALLRGDIEQVLVEALPHGTDIRYGTSVASVDSVEGGVAVTLTTGEREIADLLVGADGIHSRVRELIFGPEREFLRFLGYHTAAFLLRDPAIEAGLARRFAIVSVPKRQLGLYAIGDGTVATFFAHAATAEAVPDDPAAELRRVYGDLGWHIPAVLEALGPVTDLYYDVVAQIAMPRWTRGRCVLVGDAAHAVSLLAGQGTSLAIGGPYVLAEALREGTIEAALVRFERDVKPAVESKQAAGRKTADWFVPPTRFHDAVRNVFLNAVQMPGLSGLLRKFLAPSAETVVRRG